MTPQPRCTQPGWAGKACKDCRYNPLNQLKQPSRGTVAPKMTPLGCLTRSPLGGKA